MKIQKRTYDGYEEKIEDTDLESIFHEVSSEIRDSKNGELEKIKNKIDLIYDILYLITQDSNNQSIKDIVELMSHTSDHNTYFIKE